MTMPIPGLAPGRRAPPRASRSAPAPPRIVVTEYGWADLKGKTLAERARALIALAHPDFRESLAREAHAMRRAPP